MQALIVNADDFGFTTGINRAIVEAHTRGIVTSATVMVNMPAFEEAVALAKAHPALGVGLHFNITQGRPIAAFQTIPSLLNESGEFLGTSTRLAQRMLMGRLPMREVILEFRAQVERALDAGLTLTHVDSHKHAHALAIVCAAMNYTMGLYGIGAMRLPREPVRWRDVFSTPKLCKQMLTAQALNHFCRTQPRMLAETQVQTPDAFFGVTQTGHWNKAWLYNLLANLPGGITELMCHPGYDDDGLQTMKTRLRASRENELRLLTDPEIIAFIKAQNIRLLHFGDLKKEL